MNFKKITTYICSLAALASCNVDDNVAESARQKMEIGVASILIEDEVPGFTESARSRNDYDAAFVDAFATGDVVCVQVTGSIQTQYFYYTLNSQGSWQSNAETPLYEDQVTTAKSIVAHFIPNGTADNYSWKSSSDKWDGTGVYPDILVDNSVSYEEAKLNINFEHLNGILNVTLKDKSSNLVSGADIEMKSSIAYKYYEQTSAGYKSAQGYMPPREVTEVGDGLYTILLTSLSSYDAIFEVSKARDLYRFEVARADIESNKKSSLELKLK